MKRAERRNHKERMKNRARKILKQNHNYDELSAVKLADNMKECQHVGCCNPRRKLKEITRQEKKNLLKFKEM